MSNLFRDVAEKRLSNLPSTGYSIVKKKGGRCTRNAEISPCDADELADAGSDVDNDDNNNYSPTPAYKIICTTRPKKQDAKMTLDSSYIAFLCPSTFDTKQFIRGHPQVYSHKEIVQFDANFQKQLAFNFCATRASRKKSVLMHEARTSRLCDMDLDVTPTSFSLDSTDCHKLSKYILEDLLSCPVGCQIIICIHSGAKGNPTEESYLEQAKHVVDQ